MTNVHIEYPDQGPAAPITARLLLDSITDGGHRITSWHLTYPRPVHSELLTHRVFSRCSASSRAIPMERMRRRILAAPFIPLEWGANRPGMQAAGDVEDPAAAEAWWRAGLELAAEMHAAGQALGLHKQVVNRILEPWMMIEVICTATEWANFFALRDHRMAEPHIRELARQMREIYYSHRSTHLPKGGWHLPMVRLEDVDMGTDGPPGMWANVEGERIDMSTERCTLLRKISAARCARVSYLNHDGRRDLADDVALHDRLLAPGEPGDPMHLSPFEHQAQSCTWISQSELGNFRGWLQYRKLFEREAGPNTSVRCEACGIWAGEHVVGCTGKPLKRRKYRIFSDYDSMQCDARTAAEAVERFHRAYPGETLFSVHDMETNMIFRCDSVDPLVLSAGVHAPKWRTLRPKGRK